MVLRRGPAGGGGGGGGDRATAQGRRLHAGNRGGGPAAGAHTDLDVRQPLLLLPVPHGEHVVIGVVHCTEAAASILGKKGGIHRKTTLENKTD